ncbi:MAG: cbb3-type cytochrome c oxidase subunit 3 [Beijerinckiaceae bacterium]
MSEAMTTYVQHAHFAQTWGLVFFVVLFALVLLYALRPSKRAEFDRAARAPLEND